MAPEQVRGKRGDERTDIYALGTMLYEMVTGDLPYVAGNVHSMMQAKLNQEARPPRDVYAGIDPKIEEIILRAIERSPRERYPTAKEMLIDLEHPELVTPRDRSSRKGPPLYERLHFPRRLLMPLVLVLVIGGLAWLTVATGRSHSHRPSALPADTGPGVGGR
jgi:serine/threonine protein kinase